MALTYLRPAAVYLNGSLYASGAPVWNDADSATGPTITSTHSSSGSVIGWLEASEVDPADVISIGVHMELVLDTTEATTDVPFAIQIVFANPGGTGSAPFTDIDFYGNFPGLGDGSPATLDYTFVEDDYNFFSMLDMATHLTQADPTSPGMRALRFRLPPSGDALPASGQSRTLLVREASVVLETSDPPSLIAMGTPRQTFQR